MKKPIQPSHTWYDDALTGTAAAVGYMGFEYGVQNSMTNAAALENLTGINEQTLRHQGSDFFGAAFLASSLGHMTTNVLFHFSQNVLPEKWVQGFANSYKEIRTAVTFGALSAVEAAQSVQNGKPLDLDDIVAYGAGLVAIHHAQDIGKLAVKGVRSAFGPKNTLKPSRT